MLGNLHIPTSGDTCRGSRVGPTGKTLRGGGGGTTATTHRFLPRPGVHVGVVKSNCNQQQKLESDG